MEQFAIALVSPRSIAWLVRLDEWDRLEKIVKYNCATLGGYYNVIVPLAEQDTLSDEYRRFLASYDPDIIVLAPNMDVLQAEQLLSHLHPFLVIPWKMVSGIASIDPISGGSGLNMNMLSQYLNMFDEKNKSLHVFVATADKDHANTSRLALVMCGDVEPRKVMWDVIDEELHIDATGYREHYLEKRLKVGVNRNRSGAYLSDDADLIAAPDRYQLNNLIDEKYIFPLADAVTILRCCCSMQHFPFLYQSFIGLTINYVKTAGTPQRKGEMLPPAMVILVSDNFGLEEAALAWNLRADAVYVAWLSFAQIENQADEIFSFLESDTFAVYLLTATRTNITFSSSEKDFDHLSAVINALRQRGRTKFLRWEIANYRDLVSYSYVRPHILYERVALAKELSKFAFIPRLPQDTSGTGMYVVTLEWNGSMFPSSATLVEEYISSKVDISLTVSDFVASHKDEIFSMSIPSLRIGNDRYIRAQVSTGAPLEFNRPLPEQIAQTLFKEAEFSGVEPTSTARYHKIFVERAGGLDKATEYLASPSYRILLETLADNSKKTPGWLLDYPSRRRSLNHLHVLSLLSSYIPPDVTEYFNTISDQLPQEVVTLLEKGILERGFLRHWKQGTLDRIERLRTAFEGEVIILSEQELYPDKSVS